MVLTYFSSLFLLVSLLQWLKTLKYILVNLTGNNLLDFVNYKRYKILKTKDWTQTQASKIISMYLPGAQFGPGGKIAYTVEGGTTSNFCEYSVHVLA